MMPSGGSTPYPEDKFEGIKSIYDEAVKYGLQYEWLQWFIGGMFIDKKEPFEAADDAAVEWDF